jgi:hypothetical protein
MKMRTVWTLLAILVPFGTLTTACGDRDERAALQEDDLDRELEMALEGDTLPATFEDVAIGTEPDAAPGQSAAAPSPRAPTRQPQATQPRQQQPTQQPTQQAPQATPQPRTVTYPIPAGTSFAVQLNQTLSTETNSAGDSFTATLSDPIIAGDGTTLIPAGATVRGRVTRVEKSDRVGETAVISVAFEAISFGGRSFPLQATVIEANPERRTRTSTAEQAGKVAAGAAAGAILGQVLGKDRQSTLRGAVVGAAAGTAIAMGTADVDAVLPTGSRIVIRLDQPIQIEQTVS